MTSVDKGMGVKLSERLFTWWKKPSANVDVKAEIDLTPVHTFPSGNVWGWHIQWLDFPNTIHGHIDTFVVPGFKVGAIIAAEMKSGRVALFRIDSLDWQSNPTDMFFGKVEFIQYQEGQALSEAQQ